MHSPALVSSYSNQTDIFYKNFPVEGDKPAQYDEGNGTILTGNKVPNDSSIYKDLWLDSFNAAYNALDFSSTTSEKSRNEIVVGMDMCKQVQQIILEEASTVISGHKISTAPDFRYTILDELSPQRMFLFSQPIILFRFAHFLIDAHTSIGKWRGIHDRPVVVGVHNTLTATVHFVATAINSAGEIKKNCFGKYFRMAARLCEIETWEDSAYHTAVITLPINDTQRFLLALQDVISGSTI